MHKLVQLLAAALILANILSAQNQENRSGLFIKAVAPIILADALEVHLPLDVIPAQDPGAYKGDWISIRLNAYDFGKWHKIKTDESRVLRFFTEPSPLSKEVGRLQISSRTGQHLLFFMGDYENKRYRTLSVPSETVDWGEYCMFNTTKMPISFQLSESKEVAEPNSMITIKPKTEKFPVLIHSKDENGIKEQKNTNWYLTKRHREFVFCIQRPNSKRLKWIHVRDTRSEGENS